MKLGKLTISRSMMQMMAVFTVGYISYTVPYVLLVPYLTNIGYSGSEQGIIIACGSLFGMVGQMIFGFLCDKFRSVKKFVYLVTICLALVTWLFYSLSAKQFFLHLGIGIFVQGFFNIINGLLDSWALEVDDTCKENYGCIRAFGAIGWIIGSPIVAWVVAQYNYSYLGYMFALISIASFAICYFAPDAQKKGVSRDQELKLSDVRRLVVNKRYMLLLCVFLLAYFCMQAEGFLANQKMAHLVPETAAHYTSLKASFGAMFELPFFFLGGYLIKKFGSVKLLLLALSMYFIRMGLDFVASEQLQLVYIAAMQLVTFPLLTVTTKEMIDREIPPELRSSGQQIAYSVYNQGSTLLAPLVCGLMMDTVGINVSLVLSAVLVLFPLGLAIVYQRMDKTRHD